MIRYLIFQGLISFVRRLGEMTDKNRKITKRKKSKGLVWDSGGGWGGNKDQHARAWCSKWKQNQRQGSRVSAYSAKEPKSRVWVLGPLSWSRTCLFHPNPSLAVGGKGSSKGSKSCLCKLSELPAVLELCGSYQSFKIQRPLFFICKEAINTIQYGRY